MSESSRGKLFITCQEATFLITVSRERRISLGERIRLLVHLAICVFCRRFLRQTRQIDQEAKKLVSSERLSQSEKQGMEKTLSDREKEGI
jgi:hypothetical protein